MKLAQTTLPEIWGGIESTVNRVGDRYFDQTIRTGHHDRISDLARFADLGIRAIRYPVIWERTAPTGLEHADWRWPDERLGALRQLGLRPIVGLLHHGSGPRGTNLLDPGFPRLFAAYARAVAERYPWVEEWTPVNEPLTTARFSSLYGHWYPHLHDDLSFARTLLNQCRAVVLAMTAIRTVNSAARLVQTDDLGKTFATPDLAYQAEWENERRWLSWDLLTGTLTPDRPLWSWMRSVGVAEAELTWFNEHPCPPDIVGINQYLSSARFLDHRLDRYPTAEAGANGTHRYVDVLAARVLPDGVPGTGDFLLEAWERYHLPVAVTEVHNGSTREEQMRWLNEVWRGAREARATGADVRAVTVWSLLGAFDWDHMVTQDQGHYEPGVFDLRTPGGQPRPTALAHMVRDLASEGAHAHPVLAEFGWWRQPDRFYHPTAKGTWRRGERGRGRRQRPILIVGEERALLQALRSACEQRYLAHQVLDGDDPALVDSGTIDEWLGAQTPWAVIDLRGMAGRCRATAQPREGQCHEKNATIAALTTSCAAQGISHLVWAVDKDDHDSWCGGAPTSLRQDAAANLAGHILPANAGPLIIYTGSLPCGAGQETNIHPSRQAAPALASSTDESAMQAERVSEVVHDALDLLVDGEQGIWSLPYETLIPHAGSGERSI